MRPSNGEPIASFETSTLVRRHDRTVKPGETPGLKGIESHTLLLQRSAGNAAVASLLEGRSPLEVANVSRGEPMAADVRSSMEQGFGDDFGDVRVHTDRAAGESATALGAEAYTVGNDVFFAPGRYSPESYGGRHVLAHELAHVVQQRSGPVDGTPRGDGISVSDPSDRFELAAADTADQVMARQAPAANGAGAVGPGVQRQLEDEDVPIEEGLPARELPEDEDGPAPS